MRFALTQKLLTYGLALVASAPLISSGEIGVQWTALLVVLAIIGWFVEPPLANNEALRRSFTVGMAVMLGVEVWRYASGAPLPQLAMELAFVLLGAKLCNRGSAGDYYQIAALSFVQVIAATIAIDDLAYALSFVLFVAIAPPMLAIAYLRREMEKRFGADPRGQGPAMLERLLRSKRIITPKFVAGIAALSVPVLFITALLFVGFPRMGWGFMGRLPHNKASAGFGDSVALGDLDIVRQDSTVVVRLEPLDPRHKPQPYLPIRLRGGAFDVYTNDRWSRSATSTFSIAPAQDNEVWLAPVRQRAAIGEFEVMIEPLDTPVVFVPERTERLRTFVRSKAGIVKPRLLEINALGEVRFRDDARVGLRYTVRQAATIAPPGAAPTPSDHTLRLDAPDPRRAALARQLAGQGSELQRATRLVNNLRTLYGYSLQLSESDKNLAEANPLDRFLFSRRTGTCEHFATALTLLLRYEGIPARTITGFLGADWNPLGGFYAVRQRSAHSWTEAWLDGRWQTLDATPAGTDESGSASVPGLWLLIEALRMRWHKYIVGFDASLQLEMAKGLKDGLDPASLPTVDWRPLLRWLLLGLGAAAVLVLLRRVWRRRTARGGKSSERPRSAEIAQATLLYRRLEKALAALSLPRPAGTTPLEHATILGQAQQPVAADVQKVTMRYLEVRFGKEQFGDKELESLMGIVQAMALSAKKTDAP